MFFKVLIFTLLGLSASLSPIHKDDDAKDNTLKKTHLDFLFDYISIRYSDYQFSDFIYVAVKKQKLFFFKDGELQQTYSISTAKNGVGQQKHSFKTPVGLHQITFKMGHHVPEGGIIKAYGYTGKIAAIHQDDFDDEEDQITSRVVRLKGLEKGINQGGQVDSYSRQILIHGTHEEGLIGQPASHGCVRMKNKDIIDLYPQLRKNMLVLILNI